MKRTPVSVWLAVAGLALVLGVAGCAGGSTTTETTGSGFDTTLQDAQTTVPETVIPTTSTTESPELDLRSRVDDWVELLASVKDSGEDRTQEIAAFLWPIAEATEAAAAYQEAHTADPDPASPIAGTEFEEIVSVVLYDKGESATVLCDLVLIDRDGTRSQGLQLLTWTRQGGIWYRTVDFEPPTPMPDGVQPIDACIQFEDLSWSVESVSELTRLVSSDEPRRDEAYLVLRVRVDNDDGPGSAPGTPTNYELVLYDEENREFAASKAFDARFPAIATAREDAVNPGTTNELAYCFEVPKGLDLSELWFEILPSSN